MKLHRNAALSWRGGGCWPCVWSMQGWTLTAAAEAAGVSVRCARKWIGRYRARGRAGSLTALRRLNGSPTAPRRPRRSDRRAAAAADDGSRDRRNARMPLSTVSAVLKRKDSAGWAGSGSSAVRYERSRPGELVHIDVKKLGRIQAAPASGSAAASAAHSWPRLTDAAGKPQRQTGWEYVHIAVDDYSRLAYAEVLPDEKATTATRFLVRAFASSVATASRSSAYSPTTAAPTLRYTPSPADARHQTPPHSRLPAPDQRQSRTLHPHHARRLGLRRHLPLKQRTHPALDGWL